eukprot:1963563-Heterocapsa_arctica.AAC.1
MVRTSCPPTLTILHNAASSGPDARDAQCFSQAAVSAAVGRAWPALGRRTVHTFLFTSLPVNYAPPLLWGHLRSTSQ